jgi:hypothetical protein
VSGQPASLDGIVEAHQLFDAQMEQVLGAMSLEEPMSDPMMMQEMYDEQMMDPWIPGTGLPRFAPMGPGM